MNAAPAIALPRTGWSMRAWRDDDAPALARAGLRLEAVQPRSAFKRGKVIDRLVYAAYR